MGGGRRRQGRRPISTSLKLDDFARLGDRPFGDNKIAPPRPRLVLHDLIARCEAAGFAKMLSRILKENTASRALCAAFGFREVGVYERHARLDGVWRDVVIVEKLLGQALEPPA